MILVRRELKGKVYTEPFSKGILSRTLIRAELNPSKAYEIANKIESDLELEKDTEDRCSTNHFNWWCFWCRNFIHII